MANQLMRLYEEPITIDDHQLRDYAQEAASVGLSIREYTELTLLNGLRIASVWMKNSGFIFAGAEAVAPKTRPTQLLVPERSNQTSEVYHALWVWPPVNSQADTDPPLLTIARTPQTTINVCPDMTDRTALMAGMLNADVGAYVAWAYECQGFVSTAMRVGKVVLITTPEGIQELADIL